jgi:hypothetical protein
MAVDFTLRCRGTAHNPECDCREAEAPIQGMAARWKKAAAMANHASTRTTQLYDRRRDEVGIDEVERIVI